MHLPITSPAHLRAFHIGGYWRGANDMVRQMMLGLRGAGAEVFEYSTDDHREALDTEGRIYDRGTTGPVWLRWEFLREEIERFDPHLVICNAGGLSFRPEDARELRRRRCLLGIALSDPDVFEPATRHIAANFDLFLTNAPACVPRYEALGARAEVLPIATNEAFFHPVPPDPRYACEALVLGRAHPDRIEPVRALLQNFDTHVYGEGWEEHGIASRGLIYGDGVLAALNSAKATMVFFRTGGGHSLVKVGLFDFAAAGALVFTDRFPEVERYFTWGKEIVGFESTADLLEKVRHYLDHPEEADAIRRAGRARVLAEHTWPRVWPRILARLGEVRLREVAPGDSASLYRWRMEPETRTRFRNTEPVPFEVHEAFLARYFQPGNTDRWFVIEAHGEPVGAIALYGFSADGREAEWGRFVIAPEHRGHGWGRRGLELLIGHARKLGVRSLRCEVLAGNGAAEGLYRRLGFAETGSDVHEGRRFLHLALKLTEDS